MHVDATTSCCSVTVTNQPSSICRTAIDALQAKYSAFNLHSIAATSASSTGSACSHEEIQIEREQELSSPNNTGRYVTLLRSMTEFYIPRPKRQTSLVNAGYKIRVACVLHHIEAFISFHQRWSNNSNTTTSVNIIIPGCGLDVTGLWSLALHREKSQHGSTPVSSSEMLQRGTTGGSIRGSVHVIEIDLPAICESKAQALQSAPDLLSDELHLVEMVDDDNDATGSSRKYLKMKLWQTRPKTAQNTTGSNYPSNKEANKYSLISADLQDAAAMEEIFISSKFIDRNLPTLILSELVMAYLSTKSSNDLLQQLAACFRHNGSCTILYEPLGPSLIPFLPSTNNMNSDIIDSDNQRDHGKNSVDSESETTFLSTLESYKNFYCNSFNDKLLKGNASTKSNNYETASPQLLNSRHHYCQQQEQQLVHMFHPLGTSPGTVSERLKGLGFSVVNVAPVGIVASRLSSLSVMRHQQQSDWYSTTTELFDEHAALVLHLSSYIVVCAFHNNVSDNSNNIYNDYTVLQNISHPLRHQIDVDSFRHYMCPWISKMGLLRRPSPISCRLHLNDPFTSHCGWITQIRKGDEKYVRQMFQATYQQYFDQYPSIRKMVKSALRKDLGVANNENDERIDTKVHDTNKLVSTIATRYQKLGGDFLVTVQYDTRSTKNDLTDHIAVSKTTIVSESAVTMKETPDVPCKRHVLGCIGIRKSTNDECIAHAIPHLTVKQQQDEGTKNDTIFCFEINRFFVEEQYRKSGIGTMLWNTMLSSIITKCQRQLQSCRWPCNNSNNVLYVIAITPTILETANSFYQKEGFMVHERKEIVDDLTMITYMKSIKL